MSSESKRVLPHGTKSVGPNLAEALAEQERAKWAPEGACERLRDGTYEDVGARPGSCARWTLQEWVAWASERADLGRHLFTDARHLAEELARANARAEHLMSMLGVSSVEPVTNLHSQRQGQ